MRIMFASACLLLTVLASPVGAQPSASATVDDLVDRLAPAPAATRGLRNLVPEPRSVDLVVQFDFDSARIQSASQPLLESLASAMRSERLAGLRFRVEGHADAKGNAGYNQRLSQRRAESVITHLSGAGVDRARLTGEGRGASDLLRPDQPYALENRRVRITATP